MVEVITTGHSFSKLHPSQNSQNKRLNPSAHSGYPVLPIQPIDRRRLAHALEHDGMLL